MKIAKIIIIGIILVTAGVFFLNLLINTAEISSCMRLQQQANSGLSGFFISVNEKYMCDEHRIIINAPINCVNGVSEDVPRCPQEW